MKNFFSIIVVFLLIFSITLAKPKPQSHSILTKIDMFDEAECWDLAVETYRIFDDVGHSREKCIEMGVWAYESCMEDLEEGLNDM